MLRRHLGDIAGPCLGNPGFLLGDEGNVISGGGCQHVLATREILLDFLWGLGEGAVGHVVDRVGE